MKKSLISHAYAVLYANGSQTHLVSGTAEIVIFPNSFLTAAAHHGIPLKHADSAPFANINGVGHLVCTAVNGHCTKIGMLENKTVVSLKFVGLVTALQN